MRPETGRQVASLTRANVEKLLKRVAEVQALFILVERITPFVRDLVDFVYDVGPMLVQASRSLRESTSKMPRASQHLDDVTHATEAATTTVLDKVDEILTNIEFVQQQLRQWERARSIGRRLRNMVAHMEMEIDDPQVADQLRRIREGLDLLQGQLRGFRSVKKRVEASQESVYEIMSALQVQDITAQQLAAARDLMNRVYARIQDLLHQLGEEPDAHTEPSSQQSFDPEARFDFSLSTKRQEQVDRLLSELLNELSEASEGESVKVEEDVSPSQP